MREHQTNTRRAVYSPAVDYHPKIKGIIPEMLLAPNPNSLRFFNRPIESGIFPPNRLSVADRVPSEVRFAKKCGMPPVNCCYKQQELLVLTMH